MRDAGRAKTTGVWSAFHYHPPRAPRSAPRAPRPSPTTPRRSALGAGGGLLGGVMPVGEHHDRAEDEEEREGADDETGEGGAHVGAVGHVRAGGPVRMRVRVSHGELSGASRR